MSFFYAMSYFLIYAFLGWALEVVYHVVTTGKFINRGFLNGPFCPIYGAGMLSAILLLSRFTDGLIVLYVAGVIFCTLIELIGGFVLFKAFKMRWWDYSKEPFNLGGFICLRFSLAWGACVVVVMKIIQPIIETYVDFLDASSLGHIAGYAVLVFVLADVVVTVLTVMKLNEDIKYIDRVAGEIRKVSDGLTDKIGVTTVKATAKVQAGQVQAALARAEAKDELEAILKRSKGLFGYDRLLKAFPAMKSSISNIDLPDAFDTLKNFVTRRRQEDAESEAQA